MSYHRKYEYMNSKDVEACKATFPENNEYITETAGFIPLEVKMKQFETNGLVAQFLTSDFDSNDYRDIYLNPDFNISPEDDLEDIQEKLSAQRQYAEKIKQAKSNGPNEKAGTVEPEKKAADAAETAKADI